MATNIWGKQGCEKPGGGLCTACCILPEIELSDMYVSIVKPANSPCSNLNGRGCGLHKKGKPSACSWHCSQANLNGKLELIAQSLSSGEVTETEARKAVNILLGTSSSDENTYQVIDYSNKLTLITGNNGLIYRELDDI